MAKSTPKRMLSKTPDVPPKALRQGKDKAKAWQRQREGPNGLEGGGSLSDSASESFYDDEGPKSTKQNIDRSTTQSTNQHQDQPLNHYEYSINQPINY